MRTIIYSFVKRSNNYYEFFSEGPNGTIRKVVEYLRWEKNTDVFNLAFGDWDEDNDCINDLYVSNNADRDKVLATVAATIADFMENHPGAIILAKGSTPSRTLKPDNIFKFKQEIFCYGDYNKESRCRQKDDRE